MAAARWTRSDPWSRGHPALEWSLLALQVPPRAEEITIPADVTPEKVPTHIVDYSGRAPSLLAPCQPCFSPSLLS